MTTVLTISYYCCFLFCTPERGQQLPPQWTLNCRWRWRPLMNDKQLSFTMIDWTNSRDRRCYECGREFIFRLAVRARRCTVKRMLTSSRWKRGWFITNWSYIKRQETQAGVEKRNNKHHDWLIGTHRLGSSSRMHAILLLLIFTTSMWALDLDCIQLASRVVSFSMMNYLISRYYGTTEISKEEKYFHGSSYPQGQWHATIMPVIKAAGAPPLIS